MFAIIMRRSSYSDIAKEILGSRLSGEPAPFEPLTPPCTHADNASATTTAPSMRNVFISCMFSATDTFLEFSFFLSRNEQHLPRRPTALERAVRCSGFGQRERRTNAHLEFARFNPTKEIIDAFL